jgi:hypothetical protein
VAKKKRGRTNGGVNLSEQIRTAWDADRSAKPAAIVETLKGKGVTVNTSLVSNILSQYRKKLGLKTKRRRRRKQDGVEVGNGRRDSAASATGSVSGVIEAFKLVNKAKDLVGAEVLRQIMKAI